MYKKLIIKEKREFSDYRFWENEKQLKPLFSRIREFKLNESIFHKNLKLSKILFVLFHIFNVLYIITIYITLFINIGMLLNILVPVFLCAFYGSLLVCYFVSKKKDIRVFSKLYLNDFTTSLMRIRPLIFDINVFDWYFIYIWSTTKDVFSENKKQVLNKVSEINKKPRKKVSKEDIESPVLYFIKNMVVLVFKNPNKSIQSNEKIEFKNYSDKEYEKLLLYPVIICRIFKWVIFISIILILIAFSFKMMQAFNVI